MTAPIGVNVTVNANLDHCCPRRLRMACCCCNVDDDVDERVQKAAQIAIERKDEDDKKISQDDIDTSSCQ